MTDRAGYVLAQWTYWSRKQALLDFAREKKTSIGDTRMQLEFLMKELREQYPTVLNVLKGVKTVQEASDAVLLGYKKPAEQSEKVRKTRAEYGEKFYGKYHGKEICSEGNQYSETEAQKANGLEKETPNVIGNGESGSKRLTNCEEAFRIRVKVKHLNTDGTGDELRKGSVYSTGSVNDCGGERGKWI